MDSWKYLSYCFNMKNIKTSFLYNQNFPNYDTLNFMILGDFLIYKTRFSDFIQMCFLLKHTFYKKILEIFLTTCKFNKDEFSVNVYAFSSLFFFLLFFSKFKKRTKSTINLISSLIPFGNDVIHVKYDNFSHFDESKVFFYPLRSRRKSQIFLHM